MYRLADMVSAPAFLHVIVDVSVSLQVGMGELKQLAKDDIRLKVSKKNIVNEAFSRFSAT